MPATSETSEHPRNGRQSPGDAHEEDEERARFSPSQKAAILPATAAPLQASNSNPHSPPIDGRTQDGTAPRTSPSPFAFHAQPSDRPITGTTDSGVPEDLDRHSTSDSGRPTPQSNRTVYSVLDEGDGRKTDGPVSHAVVPHVYETTSFDETGSTTRFEREERAIEDEGQFRHLLGHIIHAKRRLVAQDNTVGERHRPVVRDFLDDDEGVRENRERDANAFVPRPARKQDSQVSNSSARRNVATKHSEALFPSVADFVSHPPSATTRDHIDNLHSAGLLEGRLIGQLEAIIGQLDLDQLALRDKEQRMLAELARAEQSLADERQRVGDELRAEREEFERQMALEVEKLARNQGIYEKQKRAIAKDESERIRLLKEQIDDQQNDICSKESQLSRLRVQLRGLEERNKSLEASCKDKDGEILRLNQRLGALQNDHARIRGKAAETSMALAAQRRAAQRPDRFHYKSRSPASRQRHKVGDNSLENGSGDYDDDELDSMHEHSTVSIGEHGKSVRFREPIATAFIPSLQRSPASRDEMRLIARDYVTATGSTTRYGNDVGDWTEHTVTACGCQVYKYSNGDCRWIAGKGEYQLNHYGRSLASTLDFGTGEHRTLIRHFPPAQFEIFRRNGETTLVTQVGRRIETFREKDGRYTAKAFETDNTVSELTVTGGRVPLGKADALSTERADKSHVVRLDREKRLEFRGIGGYDCNAIRTADGLVRVRLNAIRVDVTMQPDGRGYIKHLLPGGKVSCIQWPMP